MPQRLRRVVARVSATPQSPAVPARLDTPRASSRWAGREWLARPLAVAALVVGVAYLVWRAVFTGDGANPVAFWLLWSAETYGLVMLLATAHQAWRVPPPPREGPPLPDDPPAVDVLVCTYNEPVEVVAATVAAAASLEYPQFRVHVLDDGARPEIADVAARYGAVWRTRADNAHAKAGNINTALAAEDGPDAPIVLVLDADHVPHPRLLADTVGYFADPNVALVQTPHEFLNRDSVQHHRSGAHEQSLFFRVLNPGRDRDNAVFWAGSAALLRRRALDDVGGIATETITEDYHTTIKLHRRGWRSRFHNVPLVRGLAPDDLAAFLLQRRRWALGNLASLRTGDNPLRGSGLTVAQRLHYLWSGVWFLSGVQRLVLWGVLLAALWAGAVPASWDPALFLVWWPAWMALSMVASSALGRGHLKHRPALHHHVLAAAVYGFAAVGSVLPRLQRFKVTPKTAGSGGGVAELRVARLPLVVGVALLAGAAVRGGEVAIGVALLPALPHGALLIVALFSAWELAVVVDAVAAAARRRQSRRHYRVPAALPALVAGAGGTVTDVSLSGVGARLHDGEPAPPEEGAHVPVDLVVPSADGDTVTVRAAATVVRVSRGGDSTHVGLRFDALDDAAFAAVSSYVHTVASYASSTDDDAATLLAPRRLRVDAPLAASAHERADVPAGSSAPDAASG